MRKPNLAAIVNYCTNDFRFLDDCLASLRPFFKQIIVPVSTHFFDGIEEDKALLHYSFAKHPDVLFVLFSFTEKLYGFSRILYDEGKKIHYWHSTARYVGYHFLEPEIEGVFFFDVDEIVDQQRFKVFIENFDIQKYDALRFDSYFYMRSPYNRALLWLENVLYIKRENFHRDHLLLVRERMGTFNRIEGETLSHVRGLDGFPLIHHYSWVKTKEEMEKKIVSWGHHTDENWKELLEKELSQEIGNKDFLYELEYERAPLYLDPLRISMHEEREKAKIYADAKVEDFANVIKTDWMSLVQMFV